MRVAAIQLAATADKAHNLEVAERLTQAAASAGARLVVLPEMFSIMGGPELMFQTAEPLDGPTMHWSRSLAARLDVWLVAGSIVERVSGQQRHSNTSCLIDPQGG